MKKEERVKLMKPDGSIIERPKSLIDHALKFGFRVVQELPETKSEQVTQGTVDVSIDTMNPIKIVDDQKSFEFDINRSANVVINDLQTLGDSELEFVEDLENSRKKPRKSVLKAITEAK